MKKKLLLLTTLLFTAISGAWADDVLYGVMDGTELTLYYGDASAVSDAVTYTVNVNSVASWSSNNVKSATSVVTNESCSSYRGTILKKIFQGFASATSIDLSNLYTNNVTDMTSMFESCSKLTSITFGSNFNTGNVTSMSGMFAVCSSLTSLDLSSFNTSKVTSMDGLFLRCSGMTGITFGSNFNTSNVTDMGSMFSGCSSLMSLDVSNFDTSNVMNMQSMFSSCSSLTSLNLDNFNTSKVTSMVGMFGSCKLLESIIFGNSFDTSNVTDMGSMFSGCSGLTSLDISNFDTSNVTNMQTMFYSCSGLTSITFGSSFKTSKVTSMYRMFRGCSSLTNLNVSFFDTSKVTNMSGMFWNCSKLTSLNVNNFDTSKVTNMNEMFYLCSGLTSLDLSSFNTCNVTNMGGMFQRCNALENITFGSNFITSSVTGSVTSYGTDDGMSKMFAECSNLTSLDVTNFNTCNVITMNRMFDNCCKLTSLDVSNFNTSNVTDLYGMFQNCYSLTSLDLRNFDTGNVTNMSEMFDCCEGLTSLDLSNFDTSNVTNMCAMFGLCIGLTSLDLSSFNTSNVTDMSLMFSSSKGLNTILVGSDWSTAAVTSSSNMFNSCTSLVGEAGTVYDSEKTNMTYARIDGGTSEPGYLTLAVKAHADGTDYWSTYCNNMMQSMVARDAVVYTAKLDGTSVTLTEVVDKVIPTGQAVILKGTKDRIVIGKTAEAGTDSYFTNNELKGGSSVESGYFAYTLAKPTGKELGFYRFTGTLDANKAHLEIASSGSARQFIGIGGSSETTEIGDAPRLNETNDNWYTLEGCKLSGKPTQSGIYVNKGKKVIVK